MSTETDPLSLPRHGKNNPESRTPVTAENKQELLGHVKALSAIGENQHNGGWEVTIPFSSSPEDEFDDILHITWGPLNKATIDDMCVRLATIWHYLRSPASREKDDDCQVYHLVIYSEELKVLKTQGDDPPKDPYTGSQKRNLIELLPGGNEEELRAYELLQHSEYATEEEVQGLLHLLDKY